MTQERARSTFVTVLAWIFIALSGFATVIAILQNILVFTVFNSPGFNHAMQAPTPPGVPPAVSFMASHFQYVFLAFLLVSALLLASSIGLLKRLNWARLCFITLMILAIVWQLAGLILQFTMFSSMQQQFSSVAAQGAPDMQPFFIAMAVFGVLFALAIAALFGWIVKRLLSPAVAAEFGR